MPKRRYDKKNQDILGRFYSKIDETSTCYLWTSAISRHGYGMFSLGRENGSTIRAHIFSYILHYKREPKLDLHHNCGVKRCVNPSHLEEKTGAEHTRLHKARRGEHGEE